MGAIDPASRKRSPAASADVGRSARSMEAPGSSSPATDSLRSMGPVRGSRSSAMAFSRKGSPMLGTRGSRHRRTGPAAQGAALQRDTSRPSCFAPRLRALEVGRAGNCTEEPDGARLFHCRGAPAGSAFDKPRQSADNNGRATRETATPDVIRGLPGRRAAQRTHRIHERNDGTVRSESHPLPRSRDIAGVRPDRQGRSDRRQRHGGAGGAARLGGHAAGSGRAMAAEPQERGAPAARLALPDVRVVGPAADRDLQRRLRRLPGRAPSLGAGAQRARDLGRDLARPRPADRRRPAARRCHLERPRAADDAPQGLRRGNLLHLLLQPLLRRRRARSAASSAPAPTRPGACWASAA